MTDLKCADLGFAVRRARLVLPKGQAVGAGLELRARGVPPDATRSLHTLLRIELEVEIAGIPNFRIN